MRIVYLNLARRADRRAFMEGQAAALGLSFERVEAIDGLSIDHNPVAGFGISEGAWSCFLGHRGIWKDIAERGDPYTVVLEDDVHLISRAARFLKDPAWIPDGADLVHLEWERSRCLVWNRSQRRAFDRWVYRLAGECAGAAAYVISHRAARMLSEELDTIEVEFDHVLFSNEYVTKLNVMKLFPALAIQDARHIVHDFGSDNRSNVLHFPVDGTEMVEEVAESPLPKNKFLREAWRVGTQLQSFANENFGRRKIIHKRVRYC